MATALETEYCQEYNITHGIRCTNKFKLIRADGKRVCKIHKKYIRENVKRKVVKQDLFLEVKEELLYIVPFIKKMVCLML